MRAKDIMTRHVITVPETGTVRDVVSALLNHGISAVPVIDTSGKLVGIVSEGDLMHPRRRRSWWLALFIDADELALEFVKEHSRPVSDIMTRNVVTAEPETTLVDIAKLLEKNAIERVPIVDKGKLVGIVSRANLVRALTMVPKDSEVRDRMLSRLRS